MAADSVVPPGPERGYDSTVLVDSPLGPLWGVALANGRGWDVYCRALGEREVRRLLRR